VTDFLQSVLPATGTYCIVGIRNGKPKQSFYNSLDEALQRAHSLDEALVDAYFALAAFNGDSRKAQDARALRCFFADIDCGENKPYATHADAAQALRKFLTDTGLPDPIVVNSGGGLHIYWPLTQEVIPARWKPAAESLKALCATHKFSIDFSCTADVSRILRVPGTNNYKKAEPRPVQIIATAKPVVFEEFVKLLPAIAVDLSAAKAFGVDETTKALAEGELDPCKFSRIAARSLKSSGCGQIKHALIHAPTLEEPLWRAALSIAWNCTDNHSAIHRLSKDHPDYNPEDTEEKAQRLTGKPYTCDWYRSNAPRHCEGCKHKITSPIVLGRYVPEAETDADGAVRVIAPVEANHEGAIQFVDVKIPPLPKGYFRGAAGGIFKREGIGEEMKEVEIYPHDIYVTDRYYDSSDDGDGEGELVAINVHLPQDGLRRFSSPLAALMATDKLRDTLVKHGVVVYGQQVGKIMAYLAEAVKKLQTNSVSSRTRNQMGWTSENTFVVGELEYTAAGIKLAPPASGTRQMAPLFHQKGSLEEWKEVINFYNRPGLERHAFAFFVGAGSCLLQLLNNQQVRGGVLNLVSNASGTGKTTVQMAINSIYGHPAELLMKQRDTFNAKLHNLGMLNSICLTVDEVTNSSPEEFSTLVYGATMGRAPHRMEAQYNKLRNNKTTWCTIMVTSSNAVIGEALLAHKSAADGELKRIIDLSMPTPEGIDKSISDRVFNKLAANYGVAGPLFIQHIVANREAVMTELQQTQARLDETLKFERSDRFYSAMLAVGMVAARIMERLNLHNIDVPRVFAAAEAFLGGMVARNEASVGSMETMALETLSQFIAQNINNTVVINSDGATLPADDPHGPLRIRYEPDTNQMIIAAAELRNYFVTRRVDFRSSLEVFAAIGALPDTNSVSRRLAAGVRGSMQGAPARCYVFDAARLGAVVLSDNDADTE
jgi:hypothetical protein